MKNSIDNIFSRNLSDLKVQPSADAWEKLQTHRKRKERAAYVQWFSVAATIGLTLVATYSFVNLSSVDTSGKTAGNTIERLPQKVYDSAEASIPEPIDKKVAKVPVQKPAEEVKLSEIAVTSKRYAANTDPADDMVIMDKLPEPVKRRSTELTPIEQPTLAEEFTLQTVEVAIADAAADEGGFLKTLANKARQLKTPEGVMAELREMKNEVLDLDIIRGKKSI